MWDTWSKSLSGIACRKENKKKKTIFTARNRWGWIKSRQNLGLDQAHPKNTLLLTPSVNVKYSLLSKWGPIPYKSLGWQSSKNLTLTGYCNIVLFVPTYLFLVCHESNAKLRVIQTYTLTLYKSHSLIQCASLFPYIK